MIINSIKLIIIRDNKDIKKLKKLFHHKKLLKEYQYLEEFSKIHNVSKLKEYGLLTVDEELFENLLANRHIFYNLKNSIGSAKRDKHFKQINDMLSNINKFEEFENGTEPCLQFFQEIYKSSKKLIKPGQQIVEIEKDLKSLNIGSVSK